MKKNTTTVSSPGFFWRNNPKLKKLVVLNPGDFHRPEIKMLSRFKENCGLNDFEEIRARNELLTFMQNHPEFRLKLNEIMPLLENTVSLPMSENDFLAFYEQDNAYWKLTDSFLSTLKLNDDCPQRVKEFMNAMAAANGLRVYEKNMAERISADLKKVTFMEGILEFNLQNEKEIEHTIIGQRAFSSAWSYNYTAPIPKFIKNGWLFKVLGITKLIQVLADKKAERESKRSALILKMPDKLKEDIIHGINGLIYPGYKTTGIRFNTLKSDSTEETHEIFDFLRKMPGTDILVSFNYGDSGLSITPLSIKLHNIKDAYLRTEIGYQYKGYTNEEAKLIQNRLEEAKTKANAISAIEKASKTIAFFAEHLDFCLRRTYKISSTGTDTEFRWNFLNNIYNTEDNRPICKELLSNRKFFWGMVSELYEISNLLEVFENLAKEKNVPLCIPKIMNGKSGITFKNLAPIDMFEQKKKMYPFSFPEINGRMICLTGRHGRGKSVAGNSVLQALWLAQSGLPVFAESFEFDVKDVIGAVTNDTGDGSKATVFVKKTKNLLQNIQKVPVEKSLIFIDEIGNGTQEDAGLELGKLILNTLADKKYSVIFNTQIMALAEYAEKNLEAKCLKVDKNHQFSPGIGQGEMTELIKELGLTKYLKR